MTPADEVPGPATDRVSVSVLLQPDEISRALRNDVAEGLGARPRSIPPKWFYDAAGSELFDRITRLEEYYPTEAERAALAVAAMQIVELTGADTVIELGSGSSDKTTTLLDAFAVAGLLRRYVPIDVSESALRSAADSLAQRYSALEIHGIVGDFDRHLGEVPTGGRRLMVFLGGTIGNYPPKPRRALLDAMAATLDEDDHLLLGTDLVKDPVRLVAAYDDADGVTAAFDLNVLAVINRELGADFDLSRFEHVARWNAEEQWIEMWLRSDGVQSVSIPELDSIVEIAAGEEILTEISAKFRPEGITSELADAGFESVGSWTDPAGDFAITLARRTVG